MIDVDINPTPSPVVPKPSPVITPSVTPATPGRLSSWTYPNVLMTILVAAFLIFDIGPKLPAIPAIHWPTPAPAPTPAPTPAPAPAPPPIVTGYTGALYPVLVIPDPETHDAAMLRVNEVIREACTTRGCEFRTYLVTQPEVAADHWKPLVDANGGPPVVLWLTPSGLLRATKAPTQASIIADLIAIRGK